MKFPFIFIVVLLVSFNLRGQEVRPDTIPTVGEQFRGGVVFYIDGSRKHGLIAAPSDQATKTRWGPNGKTGADSPFDGFMNSIQILKSFREKGKEFQPSAVSICDTLTLGGFTDWYLPSIMELRKMYDQQDVIGNFRLGDYTSSTEYGIEDAYNIHFRPHNRIEFYYNKVDKDYNVRCIRKF